MKNKGILSSLPFLIVLAAFFVIGLSFGQRPTYSEAEKRSLAEFPDFTAEAFWSGEYFDDISTWFSDTFPFREELTTLSGSIEGFYGFSAMAVHGEIEQGDEIPDVPTTSTALPSLTTTTTTRVTASGTTVPTTAKPVTTTTTAAPTTTTVPTTTIPTEGEGVDVDNKDTQDLGAILVVGDIAYEYYSFVQSYATRYIDAINAAADKLEGRADVYCLIPPTSIGVLLPEDFRNSINSSDQGKALDYFYASMNEKVGKVNALHNLRAHNEEYVYFRTDHHWTALGAYYAYQVFCQVKGIDARPIDQYEMMEFPGYYGSFYTQTGKLPSLASNPDTVQAFLPPVESSMVYTDKSGRQVNYQVITDVTKWKSGTKYLSFIGGDNPFTVIENKEMAEGPSCIVVKESFGNCFVPFLVEHYKNIYVVDYRYYSGGLSALVDETGAEDVIFVNNISATRSGKLTSLVAEFVNK